MGDSYSWSNIIALTAILASTVISVVSLRRMQAARRDVFQHSAYNLLAASVGELFVAFSDWSQFATTALVVEHSGGALSQEAGKRIRQAIQPRDEKLHLAMKRGAHLFPASLMEELRKTVKVLSALTAPDPGLVDKQHRHLTLATDPPMVFTEQAQKVVVAARRVLGADELHDATLAMLAGGVSKTSRDS